MSVSKTRRVALILILFSLCWSISEVNAQSVNLYLEEINRLKEDKTTLSIENETYKHALQQEQQKTAQLESRIQNTQTANVERDRQIANLNQALTAANNTITFWHRIASTLAGLAIMLMMGIAVYWQRDAIFQQVRKLMEIRLWRKGSEDRSERPTVSRSMYEDTSIRPEDISEKLYGRRRVN